MKYSRYRQYLEVAIAVVVSAAYLAVLIGVCILIAEFA